MSGGNTTINGLTTTTTAPIAGDRFPAWQSLASQTVQFFATQVAAYIYSTTVTLTNQVTATGATASGPVSFSASSPLGFVEISVNGALVKLAYYNV